MLYRPKIDWLNKPLLLLLGGLALAGCGKHSGMTSPGGSGTSEKFDPCSLLQKQEIEAVQGSPIVDTKSTTQTDGSFRVSQCFYTAKEFSRSVSLAVSRTNPKSANARSPKDFWKETFGRYSTKVKEEAGDEKKRESLREQEEESAPPKEIEGLGDDAYWTTNRVGGALYVLKNDVYIRISLGGPDDEQTKLDKSKKLAQKALERLRL